MSTPEELARINIDRQLTALSPVVWSKYLEMVLRSPDSQKLAQSKVQTTAIPDLQLGLRKRFLIPLPTLEELRRIVAEVERRLSVAWQVESAVEGALCERHGCGRRCYGPRLRGG